MEVHVGVEVYAGQVFVKEARVSCRITVIGLWQDSLADDSLLSHHTVGHPVNHSMMTSA